MSKILKGIKISEADRSEAVANWGLNRNPSVAGPKEYAIRVGDGGRFIGDRYKDEKQAKLVRDNLKKNYADFLHVVEVPSKMNEGLDEAVGDNYLYHATQPSGMMRILRSGFIKASHRPQEATKSRTQSPTVSTTRSKSYAESNDFVDFLNLPNEGNAVIIVFDRNAVANHYKMFSTSQGTQTVGDEFEEVIVVPKGQMPIKGTMKGFYFNPKRTAEIEEFKDMPWFNELLNSPYYMGQTQGMVESSEEKETTKGSVTSNFKIGPKSEYDKGKADSYYKRGDRSAESPDPKEYLRGYDENDDYKDCGRDDPVDEGTSNILKGISRMVKGKPTPSAEYQKYFDAYKKAMQTGDKAAIASATRDLHRIEKVAGPAFFEGLGLPYPGTYEQERGLESTDEQLDEKWSDKYKRSIDCSHPKGFSQRAHCQGKKKK